MSVFSYPSRAREITLNQLTYKRKNKQNGDTMSCIKREIETDYVNYNLILPF